MEELAQGALRFNAHLSQLSSNVKLWVKGLQQQQQQQQQQHSTASGNGCSSNDLLFLLSEKLKSLHTVFLKVIFDGSLFIQPLHASSGYQRSLYNHIQLLANQNDFVIQCLSEEALDVLVRDLSMFFAMLQADKAEIKNSYLSLIVRVFYGCRKYHDKYSNDLWKLVSIIVCHPIIQVEDYFMFEYWIKWLMNLDDSQALANKDDTCITNLKDPKGQKVMAACYQVPTLSEIICTKLQFELNNGHIHSNAQDLGAGDCSVVDPTVDLCVLYPAWHEVDSQSIADRTNSVFLKSKTMFLKKLHTLEEALLASTNITACILQAEDVVISLDKLHQATEPTSQDRNAEEAQYVEMCLQTIHLIAAQCLMHIARKPELADSFEHLVENCIGNESLDIEQVSVVTKWREYIKSQNRLLMLCTNKSNESTAGCNHFISKATQTTCKILFHTDMSLKSLACELTRESQSPLKRTLSTSTLDNYIKAQQHELFQNRLSVKGSRSHENHYERMIRNRKDISNIDSMICKKSSSSKANALSQAQNSKVLGWNCIGMKKTGDSKFPCTLRNTQRSSETGRMFRNKSNEVVGCLSDKLNEQSESYSLCSEADPYYSYLWRSEQNNYHKGLNCSDYFQTSRLSQKSGLLKEASCGSARNSHSSAFSKYTNSSIAHLKKLSDSADQDVTTMFENSLLWKYTAPPDCNQYISWKLPSNQLEHSNSSSVIINETPQQEPDSTNYAAKYTIPTSTPTVIGDNHEMDMKNFPSHWLCDTDDDADSKLDNDIESVNVSDVIPLHSDDDMSLCDVRKEIDISKQIFWWFKHERIHKYVCIFQHMTYSQLLNLTDPGLEIYPMTNGARHRLRTNLSRLRSRPKSLEMLEWRLETGGVHYKTAISELEWMLCAPWPYRRLHFIDDGRGKAKPFDLGALWVDVVEKLCLSMVDLKPDDINFQCIDTLLKLQWTLQRHHMFYNPEKRRVKLAYECAYKESEILRTQVHIAKQVSRGLGAQGNPPWHDTF